MVSARSGSQLALSGRLFVADLDLSSFGPYYADAWSDLDELERTLERAGSWRARRYLTGHHVGVIEDDATYQERLARYRDKLTHREELLVAFLAEPRSLDDIVARRFVYRPHDRVAGIDRTERATALRHLARLERAGRVRRAADGRWAAG